MQVEVLDSATNLTELLRTFSLRGRIAGMRAASAINYTTARQASDLLNIACPLVPVGSQEDMHGMFVTWAAQPQAERRGEGGHHRGLVEDGRTGRQRSALH